MERIAIWANNAAIDGLNIDVTIPQQAVNDLREYHKIPREDWKGGDNYKLGIVVIPQHEGAQIIFTNRVRIVISLQEDQIIIHSIYPIKPPLHQVS
jgi:hypothetical protein